jgi:glycosyltransferase involved in cell wall biosynthesis
MKKKIVVIDVRMHRNSGIGVYLTNLLDRLVKNDAIIFKCLGHDLIPGGISYSLNEKIYSIKEQLKFPFKIPKSDLFWSPHYNIPLLPIMSKKRVVTIHDVYHLAYAGSLSKSQRIYSAIMFRYVVRFSDLIITVSEFSKQEIIKYTRCDPQKITVIHNGVRQVAIKGNIESVKSKYGITSNKYLLFVGNVKPHKNLKAFFEAFAHLEYSLYNDFDIVIVGQKEGMITGDPELIFWLHKNEGFLKKVKFTGLVDDEDLDTIYFGASLFVFPSYYEGFGLPPLEAMLNDCPVIASNTASIPEICGNAALYFDPLNVAAITKAITSVLTNNDLRTSLVLAGREQIKLFKWEKSAHLHMKIILELINK